MHMAVREEAGQPSPSGEALEKKLPPTHPGDACAPYCRDAPEDRRERRTSWRQDAVAASGRGAHRYSTRQYRRRALERASMPAERRNGCYGRIPTLWIHGGYGKVTAAVTELRSHDNRTHARSTARLSEAGIARGARRTWPRPSSDSGRSSFPRVACPAVGREGSTGMGMDPASDGI